MILSVLSVIFFCGCCYFLIKSILMPIPLVRVSEYSKRALRVAKVYRVISWSVMTGVFLMALLFSFVDVYTQL